MPNVCFPPIRIVHHHHHNSKTRFPFDDPDVTAKEVLKMIYLGSEIRPRLDSLVGCFEFVKACIKDCWSERPDLRPDFKV